MTNSLLSITIYIDDQPILCTPGINILQACQSAGVYVPHLCYHPDLPVQNRCDLCHVEVKGASHLVNACSTLITPNMEITTASPWLSENHKRSLEPLVQTHPYDCPVCPKNGQCTLQDLTAAYTPELSTFSKIPFPDEALIQGPLIQPALDRCIRCMRCANYAAQLIPISETEDASRIVAGLNHLTSTVLLGNVIDICPAGALNPIPNGPKYSTWEIAHHRGIDITNGEGAAIILEHVDRQVVGIKAGTHLSTNGYWISDKARFSFDGLMARRIDQPYIRKNGEAIPTSWSEALKLIVRHVSSLDPVEMAALAGNLIEVESVYLLRQLLDALGIHHRDCRSYKEYLPTTHRSDYLFNTSFENVDQADVCLLVGCDPAFEAPLLHQRLRRRMNTEHLSVGSIGRLNDRSSSYEILSETGEGLISLLSETHTFSPRLRSAQNPMIFLGPSLLQGSDGEIFYHLCREIAEKYNMISSDWNGFNIVHIAAGRVGALDVGFIPSSGALNASDILKNARIGKIKLIYLLGVDEIPAHEFGKSLVIYQGSHWDQGAERADIILPGATFTEKNGFYVNMEGRAQRQFKLNTPPGLAKEDWKIIRALSEVLGHKLPYDVHEEIVDDLKRTYPQFNRVGHIIPERPIPPLPLSIKLKASVLKHPIVSRAETTYYQTDPIGRASDHMKRCTEFAQEKKPVRVNQ